MSQVASGVVIQSEHFLITHRRAHLVPILSGHFGRVGFTHFLDERCADSSLQDGPKSDQVRIRPRVRLHISVLRIKKPTGLLTGFALDRIDVVATRVVASPSKSFRVLVRKQIAHGSLSVQRGKILGRNELEIASLILELFHNRCGDRRVYRGNLLQVRNIAHHGRIHFIRRAG